MSDVQPYWKEDQLGRGPKKPKRVRAGKKRWEQIAAAKQGPCRVCRDVLTNGRVQASIEFHHLVKRGAPFFGDDVEENIVPLGFLNLAGEDFAHYMERVPGCFLRIGAREPGGAVIPAHSPAFYAAEECLFVGAAVLAECARVASAALVLEG